MIIQIWIQLQILETCVTPTQSETYLIAFIYSYVSGVTILGTTSEIYNYGTQYWFIAIAILLQGIAVSYIYIPVFATLQVGSSYEVSQEHKTYDPPNKYIIGYVLINIHLSTCTYTSALMSSLKESQYNSDKK